jgi:hypothetical protein
MTTDPMGTLQCTATAKTTGNQCTQRPVPGAKVCHYHGGASAQVKTAAARKLAEEKARALAQTLGVPIEQDPREGILMALRWSAGHVAWYRAQVQALAPDALIWGQTGHRYGEGPEGPIDVTEESAVAHVWLKLYDLERDRYAKLCVEAVKIGLDERRIRVEEQQAAILAQGLTWMQGEAQLRLDLSAVEQRVFGELLSEMLQRLDDMESPARV